MWQMKKKVVFVILVHIFRNISLFSCQEIDKPRGPWQLAFKVVNGTWNPAATGYSSFWGLFASTDTYNTASPVPDQRDFSTSSDHYKSEIVEQWEDGYISVQAIKLSFFKNNEERAYVVFDAIGKTKTTWFKCDNILYSSYTDLPDYTLPTECPGKHAMGLPLTMMKLSYIFAYCHQTTGWLVVADTDFPFSRCTDYMPADNSLPYFKYSSLTTVADLSTQLETADSIGIFFQVWDMAFKGVEGIIPAASGLSNLTGLFMLDITENDNSDLTVRNLQHSQSSQIFKSDVINLWDSYYIETVKFSMLKSGVEQVYVVFDGINTDKLSWFSEDTILYSSYGSSLTEASLDMCSIEGDTYRNWQIQSVADQTGCDNTDQLGWMLVKERKNNGTCSWDTTTVKKKPYFLYNTDASAANPSTFLYADVIAVFVHGWRLVLKVAAGGSVAPKSGIYTLWSETGGMNEDVSGATSLSSGSTYKSSIIDQWTSFYIRAVKIAAYKDGLEVFNAVFDATGSSSTDWLDCSRLLYTTVSGLNSTSADTNSYTCSLQGESSTFRFLLGNSPVCGTVSTTGVFSIVDADSTCSSRTDLPQFLFSNALDSTLTDTTESQLADTFAVFVDMANCYSDTCLNGATCQDLGGNFRCFCNGSYYGDTCANLDGAYGTWSSWGDCSVTCANGTQVRNRTCLGTEGAGICEGESSETITCSLDPCPIDGGYTEWITWTQCTITCGTGTRNRSRECTNPAPQHGGSDCIEPAYESENCNTNPCPIDGGLTMWTDWSACSVTCENGTQSRERSCTNPAPQHGGANCTGEKLETEQCDLGPCPINGGYTEWSNWTECSVTCGGGEQSRSRNCTNPVPENGGQSCLGNSSETQSCNDDYCPIDGGYTEWSNWTECSVTCGGGEQSRSRNCTNPVPEYGGQSCLGNSTETQSCNDDYCPIDGGHTEWSNWTECSVTCGSGKQSRTRNCTNPVPEYGGQSCLGNSSETQSCNDDNCPIDGGYTEWSNWTECSVTCGSGEQSRSRNCTNPVPEYGGHSCLGNSSETQSCNDDNCPIDGGYTEWSNWNECSLTCGGGEQSRSRNCTNPVPEYGGQSCFGNSSETQSCNDDNCPIDGGHTEWSNWTECSVTCGGGEQSRSRNCTNPVPEYGGQSCLGNSSETQSCNDDNCPIDGGYTEWSNWTECSLTCGGGEQSRSRNCTNPVPEYGGQSCSGNSSETQSCNDDYCPIDGGYTEWSNWTECSVTCGGGEQSRSRNCSNPVPEYGGQSCLGNSSETQSCNDDYCPIDGGYTEWSNWTECSVTCGGGEQSRSRNCTNPVPEYGGQSCLGNSTETQSCNDNYCPIDGGYTEWSIWTECSVTCGSGEQSRTRNCTNPVPEYGGQSCLGNSSVTQSCNDDNCPIDGGYTEWSNWNECSLTCGGGEQSRSRNCTNPVPEYGGQSCLGDSSEKQSCNDDNCAIDGGYTEWSIWTKCSVTCGGGKQSRSRNCTNPVPEYGGQSCLGNSSETQSCNDDNCPIDGGYTEWSNWTECSVTCGGGEQSRTRNCSNPVPEYDGQSCLGNSSESQGCNDDNCPIDGGYTGWSNWTECSVTCGGGEQSRTRYCTNPVPEYGGQSCSGNSSESQGCNDDNCPIDGGYTEWSNWTECSVTCGGGEQSRSRYCTNPVPEYAGQSCLGNSSESQGCNDENCPIDGGYSEWSNWTECSLTCGGGGQSRSRNCTNPVPEYAGQSCLGNSSDTQSCNDDNCPIDGGYTEWSNWTECSETCGGGEQSRTRNCTNPVPEYGGQSCLGNSSETQSCNDDNCPIDGGYTEWSNWTECSVTCGGGEQSRTRNCTNPVPEYGGQSCLGNSSETQGCNDDNCPIDGGYTEWSYWTYCSVTCGGGEQSRSRNCTNPVPEYGGQSCLGNSSETQSCNDDTCAIDGGYTEWSIWTECSVTCGGGEQSRTRNCTNPVPEYGGQSCSGNSSESQGCNDDNCPIDGGYTEWSNWTECSVTCGGGEQSRSRNCTNPVPEYVGQSCLGNSSETQSCNDGNCPIDGGYTEWSHWTECSVTCGGGEQSRSRNCTNPVPGYGGQSCFGNSSETQSCNDDNCPTDGGYTEWSNWTECSVTCGGGEQSRSRNCTNPVPDYGGQSCLGNSTETQSCNNNNCPVDGGYTEWSNWTECSVTCGGGEQSRSRNCTNPVPEYGGQSCLGNSSETQSCNDDNCPIDGGYTEWSNWTECSVTCGGGEQSRSRNCTNPVPEYGGQSCLGNSSESQGCNDENCPIDGGYSEWSNWTECSLTCGGGEQSRSRNCTNPVPEYGGQSCLGNSSDTQSCNDDNCPIDGGYTEWSYWTDCSVTCGGGEQSRSRNCTNPVPEYGGQSCLGNSSETQSCNDDNCAIDGGYTEWSIWTECSVTCGGGEQSRTRNCTNPVPEYGGQSCSGNSSESQGCNDDNCPIDGGYTEWSNWTECSVTCGGGEQSRSRNCTNPVPEYVGQSCLGNSSETQSCNDGNCPIDGGYTEWSHWTECSVTCGGGKQSRSRNCTNPVPEYGGQSCLGNSSKTQSCNDDNCPIDGGYTEWSNWTECSVTCGGGEQSRSRNCTNPVPEYGGQSCLGNSSESQGCNDENCPIDGGYSEWSNWTECSLTCGGGEQSRSRNCTNPVPDYGGQSCLGNSSDTQSCNDDNCPIEGGYTEWSDWTECSLTCGGGEQSRSRNCTNPVPEYGGQSCLGNSSETQSCNDDYCPIDGGYTEWSNWTECSVTCGGGEQSRTRNCTNPVPEYGGQSCLGNSSETQSCNDDTCAIDGGYTEWSIWTECSVTCGGGEQSRTRNCTNPVPEYGGQSCLGNSSESQGCNDDNCPIDGGYTEWSNWTECSVTCGGGEQSRTRNCSNPVPEYDGQSCLGNSSESQGCNDDNCPIDGGYTEWSNWTECSVTCGGGEQSRTRNCTNPVPEYGGQSCLGNSSESQGCNDDNCPIDGGYTEWSHWTECSVTCGGGEQSRSRNCTNPVPEYGGQSCSGNSSETQSCNDDNCPTDGGYTEWSNWTECSLTCGGGEQSRSRDCTNPDPEYGGQLCSANSSETQSCNDDNCPTDGGYTEWSNWIECSVTCGGGEQSRTRNCTNPVPEYGGQSCLGNSSETQSCNDDYCPIDGGYTEWSNWTECSVICGGGEQSRSRNCTNPVPEYGGQSCLGISSETQSCNDANCPIDGGYTEWSNWTECSVTCGGGEHSRSRNCTNPAPEYGGQTCSGNSSETQSCNDDNCPIDGGYTEWSNWTECSVTCGGGEQSRSRNCTNPVPEYGGQSCLGNSSESQGCNDDNCPIDGVYTEWSNWTECSVTCGSGEQSRSRNCTNPVLEHGGQSCLGNSSETQSCNGDNCPIDGGYTEWSNWTECSVTCGGGEQSRSRSCTNPVPEYGGQSCLGNASESQGCNDDNCPIDGGYTEWNNWTECNVTCGGGEQSRSRNCTNPVPVYGGQSCLGNSSESQSCNDDICPIDGGYTEWSNWTECSVTCGGGEQSRSRNCTNPVPVYGGHSCLGNSSETQSCNDDNCPIDDGYTEWSIWTECNVTCGGGEQSRSRNCTNAVLEYGGQSCLGNSSETQSCNDDNCPIDGGYTEWSNWTECSVTCGGGEQSRSRNCTNPVHEYGGQSCLGNSSETQSCNDDNCPIDGGYTEWSNWTECSVTCGGGEQSRSRNCTNPVPEYGGQLCLGNSTEKQSCNGNNCPIDGGYSDWGMWTACNVTCGDGEQSRARECTNPEPLFGGQLCSGIDTETIVCNEETCPVNGGFSDWSSWGTCSTTCGNGERTRSRDCSNPSPEYGGSDCVGDYTDTRECNGDLCPDELGFSMWSEWTSCTKSCSSGIKARSRECLDPNIGCTGSTIDTGICNTQSCPNRRRREEPTVDGGFTEWTSWTECPVTCGGGEQTRSRACTNPEPQNGGSDCEGDIEESQTCNTESCPPVNGGFTEWSSWDDCSVTCGSGTRARSRACTNPEPQNGGDDCMGELEETETCDLDTCSVDGYWSDWEEWDTCSATCDSGTRERTRTCVEPVNGGKPCSGAANQVGFCNTESCPVSGYWSEWTDWGYCTVTCEGGMRERTRTCIKTQPESENCTGVALENETCNEFPCPVDGYWSDWTEWTTCTVTCDTGTRERMRTCTEPENGGAECPGAADQTEFCNTELCPVDGKWLDWSDWSNCTASCNGGTRNRSRTCEEPVHGGEDCIGDSAENETCNEDPCPVDGYYLNWSEWGACSVSCLDGTRNRSRECVEPLYGGSECVGASSEVETCSNGLCPIDGYWSEWSNWTHCSKTCGGGNRNKTRTCNEPHHGGLMCQGEKSEVETCNIDACPVDGEWSDWTQWSTCTATCGEEATRGKTRACSEPKYGGKFCEGEVSETEICDVEPCPVDGYWSEWSEWSECSATCAGGSRNKTRACVEPEYGGTPCSGTDAESEECNTQSCPVDGVWTSWGEWSECSSTCNGGARNRSRSCIEPTLGGKTCEGHSKDIETCGMEPCPSVDGGWSDWTSWTACSMTCGFAEKTRNRTCTNPSPQWGGRYCEGIHIQSDSCKENDCPVDGGWTEWRPWTHCYNMTVNNVLNPKCGRGFKDRNRSCENPAPQFGGTECVGDSSEITKCNVPCHVITCSKEHPERCQIVFQDLPPENKGLTVSTSASIVIFVLLNTVRLYI